MKAFDVHVRGGGIVGSALALALSRQGLTVALSSPAKSTPGAADVRAYALNAASVALLDSLKVWATLPTDARTAVYDMQVHGDAPGARPLHFSAWQQRVGELAWIVDAAALEDALRAALRYAPHVVPAPEAVTAALTVLAEGKSSSTRAQLGVDFVAHDYGQRAIAARLVSDEPHVGQARQWLRAPDVLALLPTDRPSPGRGLALVWSLPTARAEMLLALDDAQFEHELMQATAGAAGALRLSSPRAAWPLAHARAERVHGSGWVLIGDAAHLIHPLAGQGLNLGLADAEALARVIAAREPWRGLGEARLLARYARERDGPTRAMMGVTDGLMHLFSQSGPLMRELRNRGLGLVDTVTPVKRWLAGRALGR